MTLDHALILGYRCWLYAQNVRIRWCRETAVNPRKDAVESVATICRLAIAAGFTIPAETVNRTHRPLDRNQGLSTPLRYNQ
jgi:hypothetical protein